MAARIQALVNPALLIWARERSGYDPDDVAAAMRVPVETLTTWESGSAAPSLSRMRALAHLYRRPLAAFYLATPPDEDDPAREFRRLPGVTYDEESPALRIILREAVDRRDTYLDLVEKLELDIPVCTDAVSPESSDEHAARHLRTQLGVTWPAQTSCRDAHEALQRWRRAVEARGILVFQTSRISIGELRGTCIPHGRLPVILLNAKDSAHGRLFTLLHEYVHIAFAHAGYRSAQTDHASPPEQQHLERAANRITAALLMPAAPFREIVRQTHGAARGDAQALASIARRIKVSSEAILRRMLQLKMTTRDVYAAFREQGAEDATASSRPKAKVIVPIEARVLAALGRPYVEAVLDGYSRNVVSSAEAADCLGTKWKYISTISSHMASPSRHLSAR